jgi:trans-aconitate 2-methyltransferase
MDATWDPTQYLRYADHRERPFWDLVGRIPVTHARRASISGAGRARPPSGCSTAGRRPTSWASTAHRR